MKNSKVDSGFPNTGRIQANTREYKHIQANTSTYKLDVSFGHRGIAVIRHAILACRLNWQPALPKKLPPPQIPTAELPKSQTRALFVCHGCSVGSILLTYTNEYKRMQGTGKEDTHLRWWLGRVCGWVGGKFLQQLASQG